MKKRHYVLIITLILLISSMNITYANEEKLKENIEKYEELLRKLEEMRNENKIKEEKEEIELKTIEEQINKPLNEPMNEGTNTPSPEEMGFWESVLHFLGAIGGFFIDVIRLLGIVTLGLIPAVAGLAIAIIGLFMKVLIFVSTLFLIQAKEIQGIEGQFIGNALRTEIIEGITITGLITSLFTMAIAFK